MADTFNVQQYPEVPTDLLNRDVSEVLSVIFRQQQNLASIVNIDGRPIWANKYEWYDKLVEENFSTLTADILAHAALAAGLTITVADSSVFRVGDQVRVDGIQSVYSVTAIPDGVTLTVDEIRNVALGANAGNGNKIKFTRGQLEKTSPANEIGAHVGTQKVNFTQIFREDWQISEHAQDRGERGGYYTERDLVRNAEAESMKNFAYQLYNAVISGIGVERTTTATVGYMNGVRQFIDTVNGNVEDAAGAALTSTFVDNVLASIFDDVGQMINDVVIVMPTQQSRKLASVDAGQISYNDVYMDRNIGNNVGAFISSISGVSPRPIMVDQNLPAGEVWFLNKQMLTLKPFKPVQARRFQPPGETCFAGYIYGEYTLEVRQGELAHGIIKDLSLA